MSNFFDDQLEQQQQQAYLDAVRAANANSSDYLDLRNRVFDDEYQRQMDSSYANARAEEELKNAQHHTALMDDNIELESRDRVQKLVEQGIKDPNQLYRIIKSDPVLNKRYYTDRDVLDVIHNIQAQVSSSEDPYNALNGKQVVGDKGFFGNMWNSFANTISNTVGGLVYDTQRNNELYKLSGMPLNQLINIDKKMEAREDILNKIKKAQEDIFSTDPITKSKGMNNLAYYQEAIKTLGLTPEEQKVWDQYGQDYYQTKANISNLRNAKETLWGANEITTDQANRLLHKAQRDNFYKLTGQEPTLYDAFINGIKDTGNNLGEELGNIMGFAVPLMVGGIPGIVLKGASLASEAATTSADLMEEYLNKHGELPNEKAISAMLHGLGVAVVDQAGTYGLVKGVQGARGIWRGVGLSEADRLAEKTAKQVAKEFKGLSAGLDTRSQAAAAIAVLRSNSTNYVRSLADAVKNNSKVSKSVDVVNKADNLNPLKRVYNAISPSKNMKRAYEFNQNVLHDKLGTGVQDLLKAGVSLAGENAGSTAIRQNYDDTWDANEIAESVAQGLVSGSAFHGVGAIPGAAIRKGHQAYKDYQEKKAQGLDSDTNFNTLMKNLDKVSPDKAIDVLTEYQKKHAESFEKYGKPLQDANEGIKNNNNFTTNGLAFKDGKAYINESEFTGAVSRKDLQSVVNTYNKNQEALDKLNSMLETRNARIKDKLGSLTNKGLNDKNLSDAKKEELQNNIIFNGSEEDAIKAIQSSQKVSSDVARAILNETRHRAETPRADFKKSLSKDQQEVFDALKDMVSYTDLYDIRNNTDFIDAIKSGDASKVSEAIDNSNLSAARKAYLKNSLNETTLDNLGRDSTTKDNMNDINSVDRTTRKMASKILKVKPTKVSDITDKDSLKNYIYDQVFNNNASKLANATAINEALDSIKESKEVPQNIKDLITDDLTKELNIDLNSSLEKSIGYNSTIKKYRAKVYSTKAEARDALKEYHEKAKEFYHVDKMINPVTNEEEYYLKTNLPDISDKLKELSTTVARNSALEDEEFLSNVKDIFDTVQKGIVSKDKSKLDEQYEKIKKQYLKDVEGIKDTGKKNSIKNDVINLLRRSLENTLRSNINTIDMEALSKAKTKIHAYKASAKESAITKKQIKLYKDMLTEEKEATTYVPDGLKGVSEDTIRYFIENARAALAEPSHKVNKKDYDRMLDIYNYYKNRANNYVEMDLLNSVSEYLAIASADAYIDNSVRQTDMKPPVGNQWRSVDDVQRINEILRGLYNQSPNKDVFEYNVLPEGNYTDYKTFMDNIQKNFIEQDLQDMRDLAVLLDNNPTASGNIERILNLLNDTNITYLDKETKEQVTESYLVYLAKIYEPSLVTKTNELSKDITANNYLKFLLNGLKHKQDATLRVVLGLQAGVVGNITDLPTAVRNIQPISDIDSTDISGILNWNQVLGSTSTHNLHIMNKIQDFSNLFGSHYSTLISNLIYSGQEGLGTTMKVLRYSQSTLNFQLPEMATNGVANLISELANTIQRIDFNGSTKDVSNRIRDLYSTILRDYAAAHNNNNNLSPVAFLNSRYNANIPDNRGIRNSINRHFSTVVKYAIREAIRNNLVDYIRTNANTSIKALVNRPTYINRVQALNEITNLSDNFNPFTHHDTENINTLTASDLNRLSEIIQYSDANNVPLRDILNIKQQKLRTTEGNPKSTSTIVNFSKNEADTIIGVVGSENVSLANAFDILSSTTELTDETKNRIAKAFGMFINERNLNNRTRNVNGRGGTTATINTQHREFNNTAVYGNVRLSELYKYVDPSVRTRNVAPILLRDLDAQLASTDVEGANAILDLIDKVAEKGYGFLKCENKADELFSTDFEGKPLYSKDMLRGMSLVGISSLSTVSTGQSEEWLNTKVGNKEFSANAAGAMRDNNLIDYQTFAETLGTKAKSLMPIKFTKQAPATLMNQVTLGLGIRALNLLEANNLVQKIYVNKVTGETTTKQPDINSGNWIRTIKITEDGTRTIDAISMNNAYGSGEYVTETLLGNRRDNNTVIDNTANGGTNQFDTEQQRRKDRYDAEAHNAEIEPIDVKDFNGYDFKVVINRDNNLGYVECINTKDPSGNINIFNGKSTFYLIKDQIVKPGELDNYIAPRDIVDEAIRSSLGFIFNRTHWDNSIQPIISNILTRAAKNHHSREEAYKDLTPEELDLFNMAEPSKHNSYFKQNDFSKNKAIWREVLQFVDDINNNNITNNSKLFYNVINTHNNRYYVMSNHLNYREFKLFRELFRPDDSFHEANNYNLSAETVQNNRDLIYGFVLHNLGLPVDKMSMKEIHDTADKLRLFLNKRNSKDPNRRSNYTILRSYIDSYNNNVSTGGDYSKDIKDIQALFASSGITINKVPIATGTNSALKIKVSLENPNLMYTLYNTLNRIHEGNSLNNFNYLIEVDGLNNGTSIHYAQSGLFGDNTAISIDKLTSVGIFQGININDNGAVIFNDYITAAYDGALDAYLMSAAVAQQKSNVQQYRDLLRNSARNNPALQRCIITLGITLGYAPSSYGEILGKLTDRDIIKYVSMPNSYGAGAAALTNYIYENIAKTCSETIAKLVSQVEEDNNLLEENFNKVWNIYANLDTLNRETDSKSTLILKDSSYKTVEFNKIRKPERPKDQLAFMQKYLPSIAESTGLDTAFKNGIVKHILSGAGKVTEEANYKKQVYAEAIDSIYEIYLATVQELLENTDRFKGRDPKDFTNEDVDILSNLVCSKFAIGEDRQRLDVLKSGIRPAIQLASNRSKVQGFTDTGIFSVAQTKDYLSKESGVTAFSPESVHTLDRDIIGRTGTELRNIIGNFVGIHDAAIVDVNQVLRVGNSLNKHWFESTLKSYDLPLSMAYAIEEGINNLRDSKYYALGSRNKASRAVNKLRQFASSQINAKLRLLNSAKTTPVTIKQYAFGDDAFIIDERIANQYIKEIIDNTKSSNYTPIVFNDFTDYVMSKEDDKSKAYKALKSFKDSNNNMFYINLQQFLNDLNVLTSPAYTAIPDTETRELLKKLGSEYTNARSNLDNSNDILNAFIDILKNNQGIDTTPDMNAVGRSTTEAVLNLLTVSDREGLLVNDNGLSEKGHNDFISNFIIGNISKTMGLTGDNNTYRNISALVALTSTTDVSAIDLSNLNSYMKDIDKDTLQNVLTSFNPNNSAVLTDFDEVPLKEFLDNIVRDARRRALNNNTSLSTFITDEIRRFANDYIDAIKERASLVDKDGKKIQVVFKCDSAIDRIVMSALAEQINNGILDPKKYTICIVPNITNITSNYVDKYTHYYYSLLKKYDTSNTGSVVPCTVLNQSSNKKLEHRNYLYQNQFNVIGLVNKTNENREFNVSYDSNRDKPITHSIENLDTTSLYAADYYGKIQRTVNDGVITKDLLVSYDSYDANGYQIHQSDIKMFSARSIEDIDSEIHSISDIVMDTNPTTIGLYAEEVNLNSQDIPQISDGDNLIFSIDSSGNLLDSKINRSIIKAYPQLNSALESIQKELQNNSEFLAQNTDIDTDSLYPPIQKSIFIDGSRLNLHFFVNADYKVSLKDLFDPSTGMVYRNTDSAYKNQYLIRNDASKNVSDYFAESVINAGLNNPDSVSNTFFRQIEEQYNNTPAGLRETTYITIPSSLRSSERPLNAKARSINTLKMYEVLSSTNTCHIFGSSTNSYCFSTDSNKRPYIYDFKSIQQGEASVSATSYGFKNAVQNGVNRIADTISNLVGGHGYTIDKDRDLLSRYTRATFLDTNCEDLENTFNALAAYDTSRQINPRETEICREVFNELKDLNVDIRTAIKHNAITRNGYATVLDKDSRNNNKPTGYVYVETASEGSNVTTFTHELAHIPLTYLYKDPKANNMAVGMYNFIADNLKLSDFNCSNDKAQEIYDYLFKDSRTADPYIECLNYLLTENAFIDAVNNMNKRLNFKKEFDTRCKSILNRFLDKISNNIQEPSSDFHEVALDILKRSIDLTNEYSRKVEEPDLGYLVDPSHPIAKMNTLFAEKLASVLDKIKIFTSPVYNATLGLMGVQTVHNILSPQENNDRILEIMPELTDLVGHVAGIRGNVANEFKQSFEGVSQDNYEYVKLRYAAKEEVDKEREVASAAVNQIVNKITEDVPTKILSNMSKAVLRTDISCLLNDRPLNDTQSRKNAKNYLKKTLLDHDYRQNQIENIERKLKQYNNGNFFINAGKGLANKLVYGVNTSGIGYTNAYEIANLCGSSRATRSNSEVEGLLDKYITLRAMQLYVDKEDSSVYDYLGDNINTIFELSMIHNQLKTLEKDRVYPDSLHKNHIPKGELHGSTRENAYALVPESEVKAYEWSGYKKIKEANLDAFYSTIADEPYYIMEGKWLPNVPYVSGIPVLSDVFDGRNKSGININGTRLVNERIDPRFRGAEFTKVSKYIDDIVNNLNSNTFKVKKGRDVDIDGVITPTYGVGNRLTGADFTLNDHTKNKILGLDNKFTTALGDHYGSIIERVKAPEWNTKAAEALDEIYNKNRSTEQFTWLSDSVDNADLAELYSILPYEIKQYFKQKYGKAEIPVQTKYITGILGYREISANKVDKHYYKDYDTLVKDLGSDAKAEEYLKLKNSTVGYLKHLFHSAPVAKAEHLARWLTRIGKLNVVVKGITTSVGNLTSNCVTLNLLGLSPSKSCKYQAEGLNELLKYKDLKREKAEILAKEVTGILSDIDRAKIRSIDSAMSNSIIGYMADKGGLPTVAEDITQPNRLLKDSIDRYIPKELQELAHNLTGDEKSWMLQTLTDLATFGDITARYAQFKYLTEDQKLDRDEAYRQCMQTFVDYSNPLPKSIQYFDSIGALPFTKFLLGNQTNIINSISKNPSGVFAWLAANSYMNVSDIYGSILGANAITNRWKFPGFGLWYNSIFELPVMKLLGKTVDIM